MGCVCVELIVGQCVFVFDDCQVGGGEYWVYQCVVLVVQVVVVVDGWCNGCCDFEFDGFVMVGFFELGGRYDGF